MQLETTQCDTNHIDIFTKGYIVVIFSSITEVGSSQACDYSNASCFMKNFLVSRHLWLVQPGHLKPSCLLPTSPLAK